MEWHAILRPHLSKALGGCGLSRHALVMVLVMVLTALHSTLPHQADRFRKTRDPKHPDWLFVFRVAVPDGSSWRRLTFGVDDVTAPGYLFVENVAEEAPPHGS